MHNRVLLIDDDPGIHAMVRAVLERDEIEVLGASDGLSGIRIAANVSPDLILLDVNMPDMDGHEVCELLIVQPETNHIPVVFLSAAAQVDDRVRGLNMGASDYIAKPFEPEELRARVRVSFRHKFRLALESKRAMIDGLTGLWNRTYFDQRLSTELAAARRHECPLACIMADIDRFKSLNDRYGHPFGDEVIRRVARMLQEQTRAEDVVCRYGGEEFAVLCPGVTADSTLALAERLRRNIRSAHFGVPGRPLTVTCSFGVAEVDPDGGIDLVGAADAALYRAKRSGRNRVCAASAVTAFHPSHLQEA